MDDSTDTIIISGIDEKTKLFEFSYLVCKAGKVKVLDMNNEERKGIVTYDNAEEANLAIGELNGAEFKGNEIEAKKAKNHYKLDGNESVRKIKDAREKITKELLKGVKVNNAWLIWLSDRMIRSPQREYPQGGYPQAGHGGKGGDGVCGFGKGQDGKPGESGPGGKGGEGGKGGSCRIS